MVFKVVRAGRRMRALEHGLRSDEHMERYARHRESAPKRHALHEDIDILKKDVDWLRFSEEACSFVDTVTDQKEQEIGTEDMLQIAAERSPLIATLVEISLEPERWAGRSLIIEGQLTHNHRTKHGDMWHMFSDGTGTMPAVSRREFCSGTGTLFAIARKTPSGGQPYLEVRNFRKDE